MLEDLRDIEEPEDDSGYRGLHGNDLVKISWLSSRSNLALCRPKDCALQLDPLGNWNLEPRHVFSRPRG